MIKEFLSAKHEYTNLSIIVRGVLWSVYGMVVFSVFYWLNK